MNEEESGFVGLVKKSIDGQKPSLLNAASREFIRLAENLTPNDVAIQIREAELQKLPTLYATNEDSTGGMSETTSQQLLPFKDVLSAFKANNELRVKWLSNKLGIKIEEAKNEDQARWQTAMSDALQWDLASQNDGELLGLLQSYYYVHRILRYNV